MSEAKLIAYVGDPAIHDGRIAAVREGAGSLSVEISGPDGERIVVEFTGVEEVRSHRPMGMLLYSLSEMEASGPGRLFVFVNSEDKDDAFLEVKSLDMRTRRAPGISWP